MARSSQVPDDALSLPRFERRDVADSSVHASCTRPSRPKVWAGGCTVYAPARHLGYLSRWTIPLPTPTFSGREPFASHFPVPPHRTMAGARSPLHVRVDGVGVHVTSEHSGGPPFRQLVAWPSILGWGRSAAYRGVPAGLTLLTDVPPFFVWLPASADGSGALVADLEQHGVAMLSEKVLTDRAEYMRSVEVEQWLESRFEPSDGAEIRALMAGSPALRSARVRLAVLALASGDPGAVRALVAEAERDWRDVVWAADTRGYVREPSA